jgi:hypothetical protein
VRISCATKGASVGYRLGADKRWRIHTGPFTVTSGTAVAARAIRIGYKPSAEVTRKAISVDKARP